VIRLVERRSRLCRLRRDDLDFLLAHHRTHLDVQPTHQRGVYRLTPRGYIGVIDAPRARIEIGPKIPLANVIHLLDSDEALRLPVTVGGASGGLIELLAERFAALLAERVAAGLPAGYVEREEALPYLRGRIDVVAQLRDASPTSHRLHCRFDDFVIDTPANRQVKAVARLLLASPFTGGNVADKIRQTLTAFAEVSDEPASDAAHEQLDNHDSLLTLSRMLLAALEAGGARPVFLIDLERAFEGYVARGLRQAFTGGDVQVDVQPSLPFTGSGPPLTLRPDIVLRRAAQALAVIDVKWKRLRPGPEADDLHQALAYGAALGTPRTILVYPGRRNRRWEYAIPNWPFMLGLQRLRLCGRRDACDAALRRWAANLI
jgi:5-methylcytosine-specific restriction enzyme subunit McrC